MKIEASSRARDLIRQRGGRVFVWASGKSCCGGTRFIRASTEPPRDLRAFERISNDHFELFLRPSGRLPDELYLSVGGLRRRRVAAYWNGCAYLM
jgi:hypothetical protein